MKRKILITLLLIPLFSGCFSNTPNVNKKTIPNKIIYDNKIYEELKKLANSGDKQDKKVEKIIKKSLKTNPNLIDKHINKALIVNKKDDEIKVKPVYVEPLFARVVIMPYTTKNGLYHEEQRVWIKIKEGHIALKANPKNISTFDTYKSILEK